MTRIFRIVLLVMVGVVSCDRARGPERIDGSTFESFERSMERVTESIEDPAVKEDFMGTVALVAISEMNLGEEDPDGKALNGRLAKKLDGKTAAEIIETFKPLVEKSKLQGKALTEELGAKE